MRLQKSRLSLHALLCCLAACGDRSSSTKRPHQATPTKIPAQAQSNPQPPPAIPQPAPQSQNDPSVQRDEEGPIGVENSSGRSGAFYIPARSSLVALPLLVILHGSGQSGADMIATFRDLAKVHHFAIVAPDSRDQAGWEVGDKQSDVTPDLTHTMDCIDWVRSHQHLLVDESHVLIAGYSAGGSSAPYIGSNRRGFTHTAVLHGGVYPGGIGPRRIPAWFSTGDQDPARPATLVQQSADALTSLGFGGVVFRSYPGRHWLSDAELRDLIDWWLGP